MTVAPFSPRPENGPAAEVSVASAAGLVTTGAAGASTSKVRLTGSLAGDVSGALNEVCCEAVICCAPLGTAPSSRQAHTPEVSTVNEQLGPAARVAVTTAPG
ncbi:hypothetical protein C3B59_01815 [Cryobacterium zongtaii]|uniref:Uncharacterized protein n=1 Tax=Cryobacterium zongtaii TaxID=1259217 RepID=A0A2S3ZR31_9MICO|nr:hypothetical protein C3B59_01815 [Cryobacterium zongtaii]